MSAEQPAVGFISLGCPKALVDSERILTQINADGYAITDRYDDADLVIVNTCGFINEAVAESLNTALASNPKSSARAARTSSPSPGRRPTNR